MSPLLISLLALALASPLFWLIQPQRFRHIGWFAALFPGAVATWLCLQLPTIAAGNEILANISWSPRLGLELALRLDGLGIFFGLIITVIGAAIAVYTGYYFEGEPRQGYFYALLFLFMTSMLGLVWANNLLMIYTFWECTSVTSYLLIGFKDTDGAAQEGARRAFLVTTLGGLAMLMGMVLLGNAAGSYTISEILSEPELVQNPIAPAAIILLLMGAFTKSAQFPFHFWLPGAMSAPTPASAYLHSATMVKAGVYLLARMHPALGEHPVWFWSLLIFGGITMVMGAVISVGKNDMKALLAYATVSQLGSFVMLLAFNEPSAHIALIVSILAHALYKGALFMIAGIIDHATGTRDLRRLANLRKSLPLLTIITFFPALSMAGLIPMFGFVGKELVLESFLHYVETNPVLGWTAALMVVIMGAFMASATLIILWEAFLRPKRESGAPPHIHHAPSLPFMFPVIFLAAIALIIPFVLGQVESLLFASPVRSVTGEEVEVHLALWHGFTTGFMLSLAALAVGALLFVVRGSIRQILHLGARINAARAWETWLHWLYGLAIWVTRNVQGTTLLQQARGFLGSAVIAMGFALMAVRWPDDFPINWDVQPNVPDVIVASLAIFASLITVTARARLSAIISLGVVGIAMTLVFVFYSAPDLAMTQLLVDILTVVLLILVFYRIPPSASVSEPKKSEMRNLVLSIFVGMLGFFFVLFTVSQPFFPEIGNYFLLNSVALGHGGNVVNVLLVDFRAFDTYGEVTVLGIAAIGGYAVLRAGLFRYRPPSPLIEVPPELMAKEGSDPDSLDLEIDQPVAVQNIHELHREKEH